MEYIEYISQDNDIDRRIDKLIKIFLPEMPLNIIYKNIRTGFIKINGKKIKKDVRIKKNDIIQIEKHLNDEFFAEKKNISDIKIGDVKKNISFINKITIFHNENILILNKPYDIPVQNSTTCDKSLDYYVKSIYTKNSLTFLPGPMHRLDKKTTGLICFSQNIQCARWFQEVLSTHQIKKFYLAIIEGHLDNDVIWKDNLVKNSFDNNVETNKNLFFTSKISNTEDSNAKEAITYVYPLSYGMYKNKQISYVLFFIPTGRNHQIRLQSSYHGFPLLFDSAYKSKYDGDEGQNLFLHCICMKFPQNTFSLPEKVLAPLPLAFSQILKKYLLQSGKQAYTVIDEL